MNLNEVIADGLMSAPGEPTPTNTGQVRDREHEPTAPSSTGVEGRGDERLLPFFSVLIRGNEAPLFDLDSSAGRHLSVGLVRTMYVGVVINWVVDLIGLHFLFHTYVSPLGVSWQVPLLLSALVSSGLGLFAVSLIRKPLAPPKRRQPSTLQRALAWLGLCTCVMTISAYFVFALMPAWLTWLTLLAFIALIGAMIWTLHEAFGTSDMIYILIRAGMMLTVGYLVAEPLHMAMFNKEILDLYYDEKTTDAGIVLGELETSEGDLEGKLGEAKKTRDDVSTTECEERFGARVYDTRSKMKMDVCDLRKLEYDRLLLWGEALTLVMNEYKGQNRQDYYDAARDDLTKRASSSTATEAIATLQNRLSRRGKNSDRKIEIETEDKEVKDLIIAARSALGSCTEDHRDERDSVDECIKAARDAANKPSEGSPAAKIGKDLAEVQAEITKQRAVLRGYEERTEPIGAIERDIYMQKVIDQADSESSRTAGEVVAHKLHAAWILSLLMPLMIITMKLTAGRRLELYLERRWRAAL